ncbi:MAG: DHH family phosphoesterase [Lachnospiraceae bacterium]|nr:DHH family phosphoesterase [Lachnospiraceae bacterium]
MKLTDLSQFGEIVIQCHDNPDADALGSGYALLQYFSSLGKNVHFIYSGRSRVTKSNLKLMIQDLEIAVTYVKDETAFAKAVAAWRGADDPAEDGPELLLMTDCQYGEGNVTKFPAHTVAVIDHHQVTGSLPELHEVRSKNGSACTIVWDMMKQAGYNFVGDWKVSTALYYGLLTDTGNFADLRHPLDRDMREALDIDSTLVRRLCNSNLSLEEMKVAGVALISNEYHEDHRYAIIQSEPCDPNILGLISDFALSVDTVDMCLVYTVLSDGIKFSVRSCIREAKASELAGYLSAGIGSGGGHLDKAGGFLQTALIIENYPEYDFSQANRFLQLIREVLRRRMSEYFDSFDVIDVKEDRLNEDEVELYHKVPMTVGYVKASDVAQVGSDIVIRTLEGDIHLTVEPDHYIMIGIKGEVYPIHEKKFLAGYEKLEIPYTLQLEYEPRITKGKDSILLLPYAKQCRTTGKSQILARRLDKPMKVFTEWDREGYMYGKVGDYVACRMDDHSDIYIVDGDIFAKSYAPGE